jgi:hypothetical protein
MRSSVHNLIKLISWLIELSAHEQRIVQTTNHEKGHAVASGLSHYATSQKKWPSLVALKRQQCVWNYDLESFLESGKLEDRGGDWRMALCIVLGYEHSDDRSEYNMRRSVGNDEVHVTAMLRRCREQNWLWAGSFLFHEDIGSTCERASRHDKYNFESNLCGWSCDSELRMSLAVLELHVLISSPYTYWMDYICAKPLFLHADNVNNTTLLKLASVYMWFQLTR